MHLEFIWINIQLYSANLTLFILNYFEMCTANYKYRRAPFFKTGIFTDFVNFLFYMKIFSPKYNIYTRINHNHISGGP